MRWQLFTKKIFIYSIRSKLHDKTYGGSMDMTSDILHTFLHEAFFALRKRSDTLTL